MTRDVLADHATTRDAVDLLVRVRSIVDIDVYVCDDEGDGWRRLTLGERRALWDLRGR